MRPSLTRATVTSPRAFAGAAPASHAPSPRVDTAAPSGEVTTTVSAAGFGRRATARVFATGTALRRGAGRVVVGRAARLVIVTAARPSSRTARALGAVPVCLVGLDDGLHELVADDVALVEEDERNP